jgi:hypothetical protein
MLIIFLLLYKAFSFLLRMAFLVIVYSPQVITSYLLCRLYLRKEEPALLWMVSIVMIALLIYAIILLLKQTIHFLISKRNWLSLPLLIFCVGYTCIFPLWIFFDTIQKAMHLVSAERAGILT